MIELEIKKREFNKKEYFEKYFNNDQVLEKELGGILIKAEVNNERVIQEYIPVLEFEYYIDVWDCIPRFAIRTHLDGGQLKTEIIKLKNENAKELFDILVQEREVIINMLGHYYIETKKQKNILDLILKIEGLRQSPNRFCLNCFEQIDLSTNIVTCDKCVWRNEFDTDPAVVPIVLKKLIFEDYSVQICYPLLDKTLLQYLPEKLRIAVETFLKEPNKLTVEQYQNIYHNILQKDLKKLNKRKKVLDTRLEFVNFFKATNFIEKKVV